MANAITELIKERGRTRADVAKALRRPPSWLYRILSGKHQIKAIDLQALADELDVPVSDLYPPELRQLAERAGVYVPLRPIPVIDQEASASLQGGVIVDHLYIRGTSASSDAPHNLVGVRVHGDCLSPWILDGDVVVVDTTRTPESGNPVVATVEGTLHVKRLRIRPSGRWSLVSNEGEIQIEPYQINGVVISLDRDLLRFGDL
jgi:transcriptional regulator with XRE-family HTH domain